MTNGRVNMGANLLFEILNVGPEFAYNTTGKYRQLVIEQIVGVSKSHAEGLRCCGYCLACRLVSRARSLENLVSSPGRAVFGRAVSVVIQCCAKLSHRFHDTGPGRILTHAAPCAAVTATALGLVCQVTEYVRPVMQPSPYPASGDERMTDTGSDCHVQKSAGRCHATSALGELVRGAGKGVGVEEDRNSQSALQHRTQRDIVPAHVEGLVDVRTLVVEHTSYRAAGGIHLGPVGCGLFRDIRCKVSEIHGTEVRPVIPHGPPPDVSQPSNVPVNLVEHGDPDVRSADVYGKRCHRLYPSLKPVRETPRMK